MAYVNVLLGLLEDFKGWLLALVLGVTVIVILINFVKYQQGTTGEKESAVKNIKSSVYWGGGIFVVLWLASEVINRFSAV